MTLMADTSFIFSLLVPDDKHHTLSSTFYRQIGEPILAPLIIMPELAFLSFRLGGSQAVASAIRAVRHSKTQLIEPAAEDLDRTAEILEKYHDSRIDFVDACIMAMAERLGISQILTYDRRDFGIYRKQDGQTFELLP